MEDHAGISLDAIIAHNARFMRQMGRLRLYCSAEATIVAITGRGLYQIAQVGFARDGSFRIAWPYLAIGEGMVAEVEFRPGQGSTRVLSLSDRGKFTTQLVKFSHHPTGLALFSQSGRVRSEVRRTSFALDGPIGRLFHLTITDPSAFKPLNRLKRGRVYLAFAFPNLDPPCLDLDGLWHRKGDLRANIEGKGTVGPVSKVKNKVTSESTPTVLFGAPLDSPVSDHLVMVSCIPVQRPDGANEPSVVFLGGYDHHEVRPGEPRGDSVKGALAAMYPTHGSVELRRRLGSIDLDAESSE